jgi:hypothetical protein
VEALTRAAQAVMHRHPAPALPADELQDLVAREQPRACPSVRALLHALKNQSEAIRVLEGDEARFAATGTSSWVLPTPGPASSPAPSPTLLGRMRESLRALGQDLEPGSNLGLARWARLLEEERQARRALKRATGPRRRIPL